MYFIDLFAGIGGFTLAGQQAGWTCLYATDLDQHCQQTYQHNFATTYRRCDIRETASIIQDLERLDFQLLTAGFPCQSFSRAGKKEGWSDPQGRGELFFYLYNIIQALRPPAILLENVPHLQKIDHGQVFATMLQLLSSCGYFCHYTTLDAYQISGLPQHRTRLYVVGLLDQDRFSRFTFPTLANHFQSFASLLEPIVENSHYLNNKPLGRQLASHQLQVGHIYLYRRGVLRTITSGICPTLLASMGTGGHNVPIIVDHKGLRRLTWRECARLQGFSEKFTFPTDLAVSHRYQQLGNSVSVPTVTKLFQHLASVLDPT